MKRGNKALLSFLGLSTMALPALQGCLSTTSALSFHPKLPSSSKSSVSAPPNVQQVSLANGVVVSTQCGLPADNHIVFSQTASHPFQGYGAAIQPPSNSTDSAQTIADLKALNFQWIKTDFGNPYKGANGLTAPVGVSDSAMYSSISPNIKNSFSQVEIDFYNALHANGIKLVNTMYGAPTTYINSVTNADGSISTYINQGNIGDFAQFYVAYFHSINDLGIVPDLSELQNEPNGDWDVKWTPSQFASFVQGIEQSLARNPGVSGNITAAGTSTMVQNAVDFISAISALGALQGLHAVTLHNYYVIQAPNNNGIPPADDPAFAQLVSMAGNLPVISTEFGGTNLKTKNVDPNMESVNPAEEMKVALDLVRQGESAAIVWNLYPNIKGGVPLKTWALIDDVGPTNAYWPFKALAPNIPSGSSSLSLKSSDVVATLNSLGYAAFKSGNELVIAISNPSPQDLKVSVDIDSADYTITSVHSFDPTQLHESVADLSKQGCPLTITLPGDPGAANLGKGIVLNLTLN